MVQISVLANILHASADLINTADLCNILAQIVDFARNLVRFLDWYFIVELLADPNLDKTIVGSADFASNLGRSADLYTPIHPPPLIHWEWGRQRCQQVYANSNALVYT